MLKNQQILFWPLNTFDQQGCFDIFLKKQENKSFILFDFV